MNKFFIYSLLFILIILLNSYVNPFEINSVLPIVENNDTWIGSTIYIRTDGRIEPPDAPIVTVDKVTYIVVKNINITRGDGIVIERSNIILDGNKHFIHGPGGLTTGVKINRGGNITIRNLNITNFFWGLYIHFTSNITVVNNTISNNHEFNAFIRALTSNITISHNIIKNTIYGSVSYGIYLSGARGVSILNNVFINTGLFVSGSYGTIVQNNTVNGKPLIYYEDASDIIINGEAGQVIINRGRNIVITGLNISYVPVGIQLIITKNSFVIGNNLVNNHFSIYLSGVDSARIMNNRISNNTIGIMLRSLSNCLIINNTIEYNPRGIDMIWSSNNTFIGNNIRYNNVGLYMIESQNNVFLYNNFINNTIQIEQYEIGSNTWDDGRIGNYWSDHECIDNDDNGVCENPYVIKEPDNVDRYPSKNSFYEISTQLPPIETPLPTETTPATPPTNISPEATATETATSPLPTDLASTLTSPYEESNIVYRRGENYILTYLVLAIVFTVIVIVVIIVMKKR